MKRILAILMTLCMLMGLCSVNVWAEEGLVWQEEEPMPHARYDFAVTTVGNKIYTIGETVDIYDIITKTWETGAPAPIASNKYKGTAIDKMFYLFNNKDGKVIMQTYDIKANTWAAGDYSEYGTIVDAVSVGKRVFVLRYGDDRLVNLDILDTITGEWTQGSPTPVRATNVGTAVIGNNIYVIGGHVDGSPTDRLQIYDVNTNTWSLGESLPKARTGLTVCANGTKLYAIGGSYKGSNETKVVEIYEVTTNKWEAGISTTNYRELSGSVVLNGKIYLMGGLHSMETMESLQVGKSSTVEKKLSVLLNLGETVQLSITKNLADNANLGWSSSNEAVATVDANGRVTAVAEGTVEVYAQNADGTFKDYISVKVVKGADETRLALYLKQGGKIRLYLSDDYSKVKWKSMDESIAVISESGQVTALENGLVIIQGELDGEIYLFYVRVVSA